MTLKLDEETKAEIDKMIDSLQSVAAGFPMAMFNLGIVSAYLEPEQKAAIKLTLKTIQDQAAQGLSLFEEIKDEIEIPIKKDLN